MIKLEGGKTAPRLLEDLDSYDPRRTHPIGFNSLTDFPRHYETGETPSLPKVKPRPCQHKWDLKNQQCNLPLKFGRPDPDAIFIVAAVCYDCRCHLELSIDFRSGGERPCPTPEYPLHHFLHQPSLSLPRSMVQNGIIFDNQEGWYDIQSFQCTSLDCSAKLKVKITPPRIKPEWVDLLIDKDLIKMRAEKEMLANPERFEGHAIPLPSDVLSVLRTYILNALRNDERRKIPSHNKKWLLCLGDSCADLLRYIGFAREGDNWLVPCPDLSATAPVSNAVNNILEDVEKELLALLLERPDDEKRASKVQPDLSPATQELGRALGSTNYKQSPSSRTSDPKLPEHPSYPSLGAKADFHDGLIKFSYERQLMSDPDRTPYYFECLQTIADGRKSEDLQTLVAIEESSGKVSAGDIRKAYKALNLDLQSTFLDDDFIIGNFQSWVADAPKQESDLRRALQIIGHDRSSQKILSIASKTVTTYEQALVWLNATDDMDDNFILTMHGVKVEENPAEQPTARHAVSLIAEHRKSSALRQWLETGALGEIDMDIGQAYNRLEVEDRTVDDELILTAYNLHVQEAPSQKDDLKSALKAIAKSKGSQTLLNFLQGGMATSQYPSSEWPVGLENIGNTCYLNSLLQFYFTIKPLRDLVLNFDDHKMDFGVESLTKKVVGSRNVSRQEVQRAQQFVYELRKLFQQMIESGGSQVIPDLELARLTLIKTSNETDIRRRSTASGSRPTLGDLNGRPIFGPLPPPISEVGPTDIEMTSEPEPLKINGISTQSEADMSSEGTLLGNEAAPDENYEDLFSASGHPTQKQQQKILEDKENLPPTKGASERPTTPETQLAPLVESSASRTNEQQRIVELGPSSDDSKATAKKAVIASPPNRPPPYPPRPKTEDQKQAMHAAMEEGAQQDVTEVIGNVLFQLECAIKAESTDQSGEQLDRIKSLFFGKQKTYTSNLEDIFRAKEQFISDIKVDVASGPRDIYEALDGACDVQDVEVEGNLRPQYTTISQIPPVLQILVQRVQYDIEKKSTFKSNNHLELKETIYMDRYMDPKDAELKERKLEFWEWKRQLRQLNARREALIETKLEMEIPATLGAAWEFLGQISKKESSDISSAIRENVEEAATKSKEELATLDSRIKDLSANISSQFNDLQSIPYRLQSVFVHRGSASYGHYWIYIRDFSSGMWRKYNDGYVSAVTDISEIFDRDSGDRPATPYFLVYVKDELKEQLVNPVCRNVREKSQEPSDVVMNDVESGESAVDDATTVDPFSQGTTPTTGNWFQKQPVKSSKW